MRIEKDTMGTMEVPDDSYYGAQTQRAFQNFQVSNHKIPRPMIAAIAMIKRSAAIVNHSLGFFDKKLKMLLFKHVMKSFKENLIINLL